MKKILIGLAALSASLLMLASGTAFADTVGPISFESPTYTIGNINGQDGWTKTGTYDVAVVANTFSFASFGAQTLRISDAVTSGSFGDQTFAKPLVNSVGETSATNGTFSPGTKQTHFEMQFDIASTQLAQQPGMHISVSPDRGDGSRMSYLRFEDGSNGINVFFDDVQGTTNPANFVETQIATDLSRSVPHTIKLTMDMFDGASNDVVKVWIDGTLVHTGTSWENYYRYDSEASTEQSPRIVKTVLFRESGTATPADAGKGYLIDNLTLTSGPTTFVTTNPATSVSSSDATLNGTNGPLAASQESFWVSTSSFSTATPNIPAGVYSTPVLPGVAANAPFSDPLSLVTTNGIVTGGNPGNMPAITPNTTYYFVAWANVGGTWYPGGQLSVTTSAAPMVTVTIDKYIDGHMATAASAGSASFPMSATWNNVGADSGTGGYALSTTPFNSANAYEAVTENMNSGSSYSTNEVTGGAVVGADCSTGAPYALVGYSTGTSKANAAANPATTTIPSLTNITQNQYIIVWNKDCLAAPNLLTPPNGTSTTTAGLTGTSWSAVTDTAGGITYTYQSANSAAQNPDGSFTTPAFTSGPLSTTSEPTPGTPAGNYWWHVQAKDADGNLSPWSTVWTFIVNNTVTPPPPPPANACNNTSSAPAGYTLQRGVAGNTNVTLTPFTMFVGAAGSPKITGPAGNYIICLGSGNATVSLGDGSDTITTGSGNENITVGNGGAGSSTITVGSGNSTIKSTDSGSQNVTAGNGSSTITTGAGNDTIHAGSGNSTINAAAGTDSCTVGAGHSTLTSCNP